MNLGKVLIPRTVYSKARWRCRSLHVLWVLWWLSRVGRFGAAIPHEPWESFGFPRTVRITVVVSSIVLVALSMSSRFGTIVWQGSLQHGAVAV